MPAPKRSLSILIIEDDQDLADLARRWLERDGHAVRHARDGAAGLELLRADPLPDVVLLDIMLPRIDGYEVLRRIRAEERTARTPVVMMSSFSREQDQARGRELGANDYVVKPLMEVDFLKRVARAAASKA
jgi:DNA-binding response OmpR family regulator